MPAVLPGLLPKNRFQRKPLRGKEGALPVPHQVTFSFPRLWSPSGADAARVCTGRSDLKRSQRRDVSPEASAGAQLSSLLKLSAETRD